MACLDDVDGGDADDDVWFGDGEEAEPESGQDRCWFPLPLRRRRRRHFPCRVDTGGP